MDAYTQTIAHVRVLTKRYGGIQGPLFDVAVGDRYYRCGELAKTLLLKGVDPEDLDLTEIDPDAPVEDY